MNIGKKKRLFFLKLREIEDDLSNCKLHNEKDILNKIRAAHEFTYLLFEELEKPIMAGEKGILLVKKHYNEVAKILKHKIEIFELNVKEIYQNVEQHPLDDEIYKEFNLNKEYMEMLGSLKFNCNKFILDIFPETQKTKSQDISLDKMFSDETKLSEIINKLKERNYIRVNDAGNYIWHGNPINQKGKKLQLVALSLELDKYLNSEYSDREIHKAYIKYFNCKISDTMFKDSQSGLAEKYRSYFNFI